MKQMKFLVLTLAILMGVSLTSCMNSDSSGGYDDVAIVTVSGGYIGYGVTLFRDGSNVELIPTNPSVLMSTSGDYIERAVVSFDYVEGETPTPGKTRYNVTIVGVDPIPVLNLNQRSDTLKNSFPINDMAISSAREYLNTSFLVNLATSPIDFALYIDTANVDQSKNLLPLVLKYTKGGSNYGGESYPFYISWKTGLIEVTPLGLNTSDSVTVRISANVDTGSGTVISREMKYKFND